MGWSYSQGVGFYRIYRQSNSLMQYVNYGKYHYVYTTGIRSQFIMHVHLSSMMKFASILLIYGAFGLVTQKDTVDYVAQLLPVQILNSLLVIWLYLSTW